MALIAVPDRVLETSTTVGAGTYTLNGAMTGFRTAASVGAVGDTAYYYAEAVDPDGIPTGDWETGLGTLGAAATLARTAIHTNSNANNAAVSWVAGTKRISLSLTATALATKAAAGANTDIISLAGLTTPLSLAQGGVGGGTQSTARASLDVPSNAEVVHSGYMQVQDQRTSGTAGGAAIAGINNRTLNTVVANTITGASVASNIITLPIGTYRFRGESMVVADTAASHVTPQLYNNTVGAVTLIGLRTYVGLGTANTAPVSGRFTLNVSTAFLLRNQFTAANASGFGLAATFGTTEVYSNVEIWKE